MIHVTPADNWTKIESAQAGDEVVIAPGTYKFRVYLTQRAPATQPIVIRAENPTNRPVWDLSGSNVEAAPGSYKAKDRGRGAWQLSGATGYRISGIVFANCHTAANTSAGIRYYMGSTNIVIRDCIFRENDNGLTGGTQNSEATVEFCEFDANGHRQARPVTHNIYIFGGTFTMRYCYVHDAMQGQNFHIRAQNSIIEYNWFARATSYEGDLMTDDDLSGTAPAVQNMLFRGNIVVQGQNARHRGQIVALFNDSLRPNLTLNIRVIANTIVGNGTGAFLHLSGGKAAEHMNAEISNNIIAGVRQAMDITGPATCVVTGRNNWLPPHGAVGTLKGTVSSPTPGFVDPEREDFTLSEKSVCCRAAAPITDPPTREYYKNEEINRMYRVRASVNDLGAFESTTKGPGIGPDDSK